MICFSPSLCLYPLPSPLARQFQMTHMCQTQTHFRVVIPDAFSAQKVSLSPRCSQSLCPLCLSPLKCHLIVKPFLALAQIKLPAYIHAFLVHPFKLLHFSPQRLSTSDIYLLDHSLTVCVPHSQIYTSQARNFVVFTSISYCLKQCLENSRHSQTNK